MNKPDPNLPPRHKYTVLILCGLLLLMGIDYLAIELLFNQSHGEFLHLALDAMSLVFVGVALFWITDKYHKKFIALTQTSEQLEQNQKFLQLVQDIGQLAYWELDLSNQTIELSDKAAKLINFPHQDKITNIQKFTEFVHPDERQMVKDVFQDCFQKHKPFHIIFRAQTNTANPVEKWFTLSGSPQYNQNDDPVTFLGVIQETTEQINRQKVLDESRNQFKNVFNSVADAIYIADTKGYIVEVNEQGLHELKMSREEILKLNVLELDPTVPLQGGLELLHSQWEESRKTGDVINYEGAHRRSDGSLFPVGMRLRATTFNGASALIGVARNLTQQKKQEELLRIQTQALEVAENHVVVTDTSGVIQWVNQAFEKCSGYSREEVIGKKPSMLKSGEHPESLYASLWETILSGNVWRGELVNRRKDGSIYKTSVSIVPVKNDTDKISHFVSIQQDISQMAELEEQFQRSQRMETIGLLAGGIAHDLNNVLAPIMMSLPLLKEEPLSDSSQELIKTIDSCLNRGSDIIRQVLTFSRGMKGDKITLQSRHLLKEVVSMIKETFPKNITIRLYAKSDLWPVNGDPTQLQQVFLNLAVNARDAMPEGGQLTIRGSNQVLENPKTFLNMAVNPGNYTCLVFEDEGEGISKDNLGKIFEPFFSTKPQGKGTGLGLPTAMGIIKSHQGLIEVTSTPGKGTCFTLWLPASAEKMADMVTINSANKVEGKGETLLIVDDESHIRNTIKLGLKKGAFQSLEAGNGKEGLSVLKANVEKIDLIVTDRMMPVMDGDTFARAVRNEFPGIPIIGMSGALDRPKVETDKNLGTKPLFDAYLIKPFSREVLLSTVQDTLAEHKK